MWGMEARIDRRQVKFFFFSLLLVSLELSDTTFYEPLIRALLGTAPPFWSVVVLKLRTFVCRRAVRALRGRVARIDRPRRGCWPSAGTDGTLHLQTNSGWANSPSGLGRRVFTVQEVNPANLARRLRVPDLEAKVTWLGGDACILADAVACVAFRR